MNHTPTPYIAVEANEECPLPCGVIVAIHRKNEPWKREGAICTMAAQGKDGTYNHGLTDDTAHFIVEACNAHDRLQKEREALLKAAQAVDMAIKANEPTGMLFHTAIENLQDIIASIDGEYRLLEYSSIPLPAGFAARRFPRKLLAIIEWIETKASNFCWFVWKLFGGKK